MEEPAPARLRDEPLILRDHLAIDRTALANERTLLGYMRTALALAAVGASALKFFDSITFMVLGWCFLAIGAAMSLIGLRRYWQFKGRIDAVRGI
jgi:putative membrane protein